MRNNFLTFYLTFGTCCFLLFASTDLYLTYIGMGGDLELEGNIWLRQSMASFGIIPAMLIHKLVTLVLSICLSIIVLVK